MNVFSVYAKSILLVGLGFGVPWVQAAEQAPGLEPVHYGMRVVFFLLIVIGLIVGLAWLVHKTKLNTQFSTQNNSALSLVAVLPLGMKEKIALVQVGDQQLLVGITPQNINLLTVLEQPVSVAERAPSSFQALLKKAIRS